MRYYYLILTLVFFIGCSTSEHIVVNNYEEVSFELNQVRVDYHFEIPIHYKKYGTFNGGEIGHNEEYWYPDSSVFYVTDGFTLSALNYDNIYTDKDKWNKYITAYGKGDSLVLSGKDSLGLLWKNVFYRGVNFGYANVPPEKEAQFENIIKSLRKEYK